MMTPGGSEVRGIFLGNLEREFTSDFDSKVSVSEACDREDAKVLPGPHSVSSFRMTPTGSGVSRILSVLKTVRIRSLSSTVQGNSVEETPVSLTIDITPDKASESESRGREDEKELLSPHSLSSFRMPQNGPGNGVVTRIPSAVGEMMKKARSLSIGSSTSDLGSKSFSIDITAARDKADVFVDALDSISDIMIRRQSLIAFHLEFHNLTYEMNVRQKNIMIEKASMFMSGLPIPFMGQDSASVNQSPPPATETTSTLRLLDQISGEAKDGEILAVMGPSGSGKSTLIDALAQRILPERLSGTITLNGEQISNSLLRSISAYVMQDDLLFPLLTVAETLMFAAEVRLPRSSYNTQRKRDRVCQLLLQLGLQRVANTIVGDEGHRGVSGGERRRVSIGIDIVHDPLLLFLDEPTSGLDSTSAYQVIKTLQKIAQTGSIVILSIHQPSYRILGLLDKLIILAFGQKIYGGAPSGLKSFYAAFGRPIPEHENSTEHALDLIQELHGSPTGIKPLVEFSKEWKDGNDEVECDPKAFVGGGADVRNAFSARITRGKLVTAEGYDEYDDSYDIVADLAKLDSNSGPSKVAKFANPFWHEVPVLMWRSLINISRTPSLFLMRLGTVLVTGFLLATVYWGLDHTPTGIQQRLGFFTFVISATYYTCADALPVFLQERYIFLRETAHNSYRKSSYVLANALIYIPFQAVLALAFSTTIFWAVGLAGGKEGFGFLFLITWASFWTGNSFVTLISGIVPNVIMGFIAAVALLAYFQMLSGFFISKEHIPRYWIWLHYASMIKYPYEAVLANEFDRPGVCYEKASNILSDTPLQQVRDPAFIDGVRGCVVRALANTSSANLNSETCVLTGHDIFLSRMIDLSKWGNLGITVSFGVLFRIAFYIILRLRGRNSRQ